MGSACTQREGISILRKLLISYQRVEYSNGGGIWNISVSPNESLIALACENGFVILFDINPELSYLKRFTALQGILPLSLISF